MDLQEILRKHKMWLKNEDAEDLETKIKALKIKIKEVESRMQYLETRFNDHEAWANYDE